VPYGGLEVDGRGGVGVVGIGVVGVEFLCLLLMTTTIKGKERVVGVT